jgi:uncharacterized RDD family membrane protein YckC
MSDPYRNGAPVDGYTAPPPPPPGGPGPRWTNPAMAGRPTGPGGRPLAEWWERLLARLLDNLIIGSVGAVVLIAYMIVLVVVSVRHPGEFEPGQDPPGWFILLLLLVYPIIGLAQGITSYVYHNVLFGGTGRTVGKKVLKLGIVDATTGQPADRRALRRRWVAYDGAIALGLLVLPLSVVTSPYSYLCVLWALWDKPDRQTLHDKYGGTVVVKEGP